VNVSWRSRQFAPLLVGEPVLAEMMHLLARFSKAHDAPGFSKLVPSRSHSASTSDPLFLPFCDQCLSVLRLYLAAPVRQPSVRCDECIIVRDSGCGDKTEAAAPFVRAAAQGLLSHLLLRTRHCSRQQRVQCGRRVAVEFFKFDSPSRAMSPVRASSMTMVQAARLVIRPGSRDIIFEDMLRLGKLAWLQAAAETLCDEIKGNLERIRNFFQS
jgi:hypothetical protein